MEYHIISSKHLSISSGFFASGTALSVVAGRLSYTFGMQGEALSVDTACSASLVAMRLGWQESLASGGSRSMVAGVNLTLLGGGSAIALAAGMLGGDGRCKTLDASADGYGRGEACQSVVVEGAGHALAPQVPQERQAPPTMGPLAGAPLAVAGIASNQDGRSSSLTAPNGPSQQAVIGAALEAAVAEPKSIVEMQMHGTGTALGDPIEVGALRSAVLVHREAARKGHGQGRPAPGGPVALSAVKSMVGHAEAAAGLSGVIQLALGMALRAASCIQHVRHVNPLVSGILADAGKGPGAAPAGGPATRGVHVARAASSASTSPDSGGSLREAAVSGVSAFAFQGTNAHAVLRRASAGADVPSGRAGLSAGRQGARVWRPQLLWASTSNQWIGEALGAAHRRQAVEFELRVPVPGGPAAEGALALRGFRALSPGLVAQAALGCAVVTLGDGRGRGPRGSTVGLVQACWGGGETLVGERRAAGSAVPPVQAPVRLRMELVSSEVTARKGSAGGAPRSERGGAPCILRASVQVVGGARQAGPPGAGQGPDGLGSRAATAALPRRWRSPRRADVACGYSDGGRGPATEASLELGTVLQGALRGAAGARCELMVGSTGLYTGWQGLGSAGVAAWPRGRAAWRAVGATPQRILSVACWQEGTAVTSAQDVTLQKVPAPGALGRSVAAAKAAAAGRQAELYGVEWRACEGGVGVRAGVCQKAGPGRRSCARSAASAIHACATGLGLLQAVPLSAGVSTVAHWAAAAASSTCGALGGPESLPGLLAGAMLRGVAETAFLETGTAVGCTFVDAGSAGLVRAGDARAALCNGLAMEVVGSKPPLGALHNEALRGGVASRPVVGRLASHGASPERGHEPGAAWGPEGGAWESRARQGNRCPTGARSQLPLAVVGGLRGVGVLVGRWASAQAPGAAAGSTVLVGRQGRLGYPAQGPSSGMHWYAGCTSLVLLVRCDAACREESGGWPGQLWEETQEHLKGLVYTAGVLRDSTLPCQTAGGLKGSSACKVEGCGTHGVGAVINGAPLGAAILFSSVSGLVGYPRHASYAAANAGLDLLGQAWQAAGSVCTSVQWGVWGGVGMATRGAASSRFNRMGVDVGTMYPAVGLWALERVAQRVVRLESAVACVTRSAYWKALSSTVSRPSDVPEFYAEVVEGLQAEGAPALDSLPRAAGKPSAAVMTAGGRGVAAEQRGVSHAAVAQQLLLIVESLVGATVSPEAPLMEEGLDSLGAVELRNSVDRELGVLLEPTAVMDYPSVAALAGHLVEQLGGDQDGNLGRAGAPLEPERPSLGLGRAGGAERPSVVVVGAAAYLPCPGASSSADVGGAGVSSYREAPHQDAVEPIPWGRWDAELVEKVLMASGSGSHSVSVRAAAMLPGVGLFDGAVFGVSQAEGMLMDPQQRLALQAGWECLQSSGGSAQSSLHAACGVYVGVQHMEYGQLISQHQLAMGAWMATGTELSVVVCFRKKLLNDS